MWSTFWTWSEKVGRMYFSCLVNTPHISRICDSSQLHIVFILFANTKIRRKKCYATVVTSCEHRGLLRVCSCQRYDIMFLMADSSLTALSWEKPALSLTQRRADTVAICWWFERKVTLVLLVMGSSIYCHMYRKATNWLLQKQGWCIMELHSSCNSLIACMVYLGANPLG